MQWIPTSKTIHPCTHFTKRSCVVLMTRMPASSVKTLCRNAWATSTIDFYHVGEVLRQPVYWRSRVSINTRGSPVRYKHNTLFFRAADSSKTSLWRLNTARFRVSPDSCSSNNCSRNISLCSYGSSHCAATVLPIAVFPLAGRPQGRRVNFSHILK